MRSRALILLAASGSLGLGGAFVTPNALAQDVEMLGRVHGVRPPPSYYAIKAEDPNAYEFQGVWKEIARRVRERRLALARAADFATLNAHMQGAVPSRSAAQAAGTAITGNFRFPVLVGYFADSSNSFIPDTASLNAKLFGNATPPAYSVSTFYDEMSSGLVTVTGEVIGWFKTDSASSYYEGITKGLNPRGDSAHTGDFIVELLDAANPTIDFSVYDNDSDGEIDLVAVLHPLQGGECNSSHIWSHRWVLAAWGKSWSGDGVSATDYMIQPAVGGSSGCDSTTIMPIGTFSHELGHGMTDFPDLYDTSGNSFGIGVWGLMGSGNWNRQDSPAHLTAWSKDDAGWITIDTISVGSGTGTRVLNPIINSDTALRVEFTGTNEYFLLENRHRLGSDVNLLGEGLLIWHVDPDRIAARQSTNTVNAVVPHGLDLEQADGLDNLGNRENAGDAGDPWPGSSNKTVFGPITTPNTELNDNSNTGLNVDSITVNPDMSIAFRVQFNTVSERVTTSIGPGTQVSVDGSNENAPYDAIWVYPSSHTIGVDSIQGDSLVRHVFQSWSDAGARVHTVIADATPDTFTANLQTEHRLRALSGLNGSVSSSVTLDVNGIAWLLPTDSARLIAVPNSGFLFAGWTGDTASISDTLVLHLAQPYTVRAVFGVAVSITSSQLASGVMGAAYEDTLEASGGSGSYTWSLTGGDPLPAGLSLDPATGVVSGAPEEDGFFAMVLQAASGAIVQENTVNLTITRPSLPLDDVVNHLLSPVQTLNADELRFLDIIGNDNGRFDVGDFRAYLQDAGLVTDVVPADVLKALKGAETPKNGSARKEGQ